MKRIIGAKRSPVVHYCSKTAAEEWRWRSSGRCMSSSTFLRSSKSNTPVPSDPLGLFASIQEWDPDVHSLLDLETQRQKCSLELIASENFVSPSVLACLGSLLTNKYAEGRPGKRYYGGVDVVDKVERLAESRALQAFHLSPEDWSVNVQPYSGSPANLAVYMAVLGCAEQGKGGKYSEPSMCGTLRPGDYYEGKNCNDDSSPLPEGRCYRDVRHRTGTLMGLHLSCGGHLTHGFFTPTRKVSASSLFFHSVPYYTNSQTGYIDYESMRKFALQHRPNLIIAGGSAYPRDWEYQKFRAVCDELNQGDTVEGCDRLECEKRERQRGRVARTLLMVDMAHTAGLIAAEEQNNPFLYADIVTTTTHKTLRGPRAGMVFSRKINLQDPVLARPSSSLSDKNDKGKRISAKNESNAEWRLPDMIHRSIFPGLQGGPHLNQIAAIATQLKAVCTPEWREYAREVKRSTQFLAKTLQAKGERLVTGGSDNHLLLWDLRPHMRSESTSTCLMEGTLREVVVSAAMVEQCFEVLNISVNRNNVPGDGVKPSGIRLGTAALTTRGVTQEREWNYVAELLVRGLKLCKTLAPRYALSVAGKKNILGRKSYMRWLKDQPKAKLLREEVVHFASSFPLPGERREM